jgi:cytidyltransferase-like protein|tara:strand:- start:24 stop:467 length:444 start_codon:yes stop_codon:yes gene_type:complete
MQIRKKNKKNLKKKVFVSMCADGLHHGHINILRKAKKYGNVTVGLMTDKGIKSYKKKNPLIKYNDRKKILEHINLIDRIVPIAGLNFSTIAKKYRINIWVHGDDWKKGTQANHRRRLIITMKKMKGKVIDVPYTKKISSTKLAKYIK